MSHELYMQRAIQLAQLSGKAVKTNPNVGSILVYKDRIIGEGYYQTFGGPHAEVNAINSVKSADKHLISKSTLYVSLEPCCIHRKTPPCTDLIIKSDIPKVVISAVDPNPDIAGRGIQILRNQGIAVMENILKTQGNRLIAPFVSLLNKQPYIVLKWAMTKDHYMGHEDTRLMISNNLTNAFTHTLRSKVDGILIGKTTALQDNPSLTTRHIDGESPTRIILDANLEVPANSNIYNNEVDTIIINHTKQHIDGNTKFIKVKDTKDLSEVSEVLFHEGIYRILVEGGSKVLKSFIKYNIWHEAYLISSNENVDSDLDILKLVKAPLIKGQLINTIKMSDNTIKHLINLL